MAARRTRRALRLAIVALVTLVVVLLLYGFAETYWIDVKDYTFTDPDVPPAFDGTRIVLLTDIHRSAFFSEDRVWSLVERVNALEPDLIVLGGDYLYLGTHYAASCFEALKGLSAPLGVYAVLGNHDYGDYEKGEDGPTEVIRGMGDAGVTLLRDEAVWIGKAGERIRLGGVSDADVDRPDYRPTVRGTSEDDLVLLLSHNPDYSEKLEPGVVDLMLCGHTHGGQVTAFGRWAFHVPSKYGQKYRTGAVDNGLTTVIVSNGIGTSTIPPIRLFARPQIVVVTLRQGESTGVEE